jgi:hypothetical protein
VPFDRAKPQNDLPHVTAQIVHLAIDMAQVLKNDIGGLVNHEAYPQRNEPLRPTIGNSSRQEQKKNTI